MKQNAVTAAAVVDVPIDRVVIGARRRQKLGRLKLLARSIEEHGLIHPILLRGETLVAGHRRLEACRLLNWKTIRARQVERMSDEELRAVELDENTERLALDDYAASKARLAEIRKAEGDLKAKAKAEKLDLSTKPVDKLQGRGRPKTESPRRAVEQETGISPAEQVRTERHVRLAERFPFLQRAEWRKPDVLKAGDLLEQLADADRPSIVALLDQPGIPPEKALPCLANAVEMDPAERAHVIELAQSADEHHHREARTLLAKLPAPPDPSLLSLSDASDLLRKATKLCRAPDYQPRIAELSKQVSALHREFSVMDKEARHAQVIR